MKQRRVESNQLPVEWFLRCVLTGCIWLGQDLAEHCIETRDVALVKLPLRRIPLAFADEDCKELEKLKKQAVIQPSTSPWAAPLVMIQKKGGSARMCLDYCRLNAVTGDVAYLIPHMQDCLDAVSGSGAFSVMDIPAAYHQIPVAAEDIPKTALITIYGLYEFKTMPFGLKTAPRHINSWWNKHYQGCNGQPV